MTKHLFESYTRLDDKKNFSMQTDERFKGLQPWRSTSRPQQQQQQGQHQQQQRQQQQWQPEVNQVNDNDAHFLRKKLL